MIKKLQNWLYTVIFFVMTWAMTKLAYATDDDPFSPAAEKLTLIQEYFIDSNIVIILATLVIMVFGIAIMLGKISKVWGFSIIGGGIIFGGASFFAKLFFGS